MVMSPAARRRRAAARHCASFAGALPLASTTITHPRSDRQRTAGLLAGVSISRAGPSEAMSRLSLPSAALKRRYDVIVVGSGYGGGVTASRLARAGKRVAVIERGREIETGAFPQKFS